MSLDNPSGPKKSSAPPEAWDIFLRLSRQASRPIDRFLSIEASSGILLVVAAAVALVWANSPWVQQYRDLWSTLVGFTVGDFSFARSLEWVVNDVLMVIFFFVVGLEIRREVYQGELSEWRRAALPLAAALGGMIVPAGIYLAIAGGPATHSGWGVPMATDIAFAVGILTLLGSRVPTALRVLLLAVAVIDDVGAILVIAIFYSDGVMTSGLLVAGAGLIGVFLMQRFGVRSKLAYCIPGVVVWAGIYAAGVHPTIAGVIVGLATPIKAWLGPDGFVQSVRQDLASLDVPQSASFSSHKVATTLRQVGAAKREALSPVESLIEGLHPWVAYGIMPIFALANAGVTFSGGSLAPTAWHVIFGIVAGLVIGKPLGVLAASWLTLRLGITKLPAGVTTRHLLVLGVVAGIGFTMSLFIAPLAFSDPSLLEAGKLGVFAGSLVACILGLVLGRALLPTKGTAGAAQNVFEAETTASA